MMFVTRLLTEISDQSSCVVANRSKSSFSTGYFDYCNGRSRSYSMSATDGYVGSSVGLGNNRASFCEGVFDVSMCRSKMPQ